MNTYTNRLMVVVTLCGAPPLTYLQKIVSGAAEKLKFKLWINLLLNSGAARLINDSGWIMVKQVMLLLCGRQRLVMVVLIRANWLGRRQNMRIC